MTPFIGEKRGSVIDAAFLRDANFQVQLLHGHADFGFMDRLIQMLDRFYPVTVEIMLGAFQMMLGRTHGCDSLADMWMWGRRLRDGCDCRGCRNRRRGRYWSGCSRRERQRQQKCCHDEQ